MQEIHVRLEPQAEPRCGYDHVSATWLNRCYGVTAYEQITLGLIFDRAAGMSLRAPIDPLILALTVRRELFFGPAHMLIRYQQELDRVNAGIIERDRQRFLEKRAAQGAAQGTRSTRSHGKRKGGR